MIYVVSYSSAIPSDAVEINTTSRSRNWTRGLSPFVVGPVKLYDDMVSQNFENAWQFSKVYKKHTDGEGNPTDDYWRWAKKGWADTWAHRYPMGRGAIPEYSLWDGERLGYVDARKKIYIPLYSAAIQLTDAFKHLTNVAKQAESEGKDLYVRDFDGYNFKELGMTYQEVIHNEARKMGHGFIIAMLLEGFYRNHRERL